MRIVIEVDGEKVTAIGADQPGSGPFAIADVPPGPPPAELLARAKKLGAISAGPSTFGRGAALAGTEQVAATLKPVRRARAKTASKKTRSKKRRRAAR